MYLCDTACGVLFVICKVIAVLVIVSILMIIGYFVLDWLIHFDKEKYEMNRNKRISTANANIQDFADAVNKTTDAMVPFVVAKYATFLKAVFQNRAEEEVKQSFTLEEICEILDITAESKQEVGNDGAVPDED